jgi:kinesin family protein 2/24
MRICICIRKRPLFAKETANGEIDSASMCNPKVIIHEPKVKVDGITKYINNSSFEFDNTYSESEPSHSVYEYQIKHLLPTLFKEGVVTCFAYGQTGSGKTFTVNSINQDACNELFSIAPSGTAFTMSFFEIYGGKVSDLLND